jgi:hypothetical protein
MHAGRTFVSASPAGPQVYLSGNDRQLDVEIRGGRGARLVLVGDRGEIDARGIDSDEIRVAVPMRTASRYVRAHLAGPNDQLMAVTSPIWFDR